MNLNLAGKSIVDLVDSLPTTRHRAAIIDELVSRMDKSSVDQLSKFLFLSIGGTMEEDEDSDEGNPTLRKELTEILSSGWDFSGCYWPEEAQEFCSPKGNVLDLRETELTVQQKKLLGVIRRLYRRWKVDR